MTLGLLKPYWRARRVSGALSALVLICAAVASVGVVPSALSQSTGSDGGAKMRDIKPFIAYNETFQWGAVPEILLERVKGDDDSIDYSWASDLFFEKEIWQLEFRYKNVRTIDVEVPVGRQLERKRVWYLVYSVTNTGERLRSAIDESVNEQLRKDLGVQGADNMNVSQKVVVPGDSKGAPAVAKTFEFPLNNLPGVYKPETKVYGADDEAGFVRFVPRFFLGSDSIAEPLEYEKVGEVFMGQTRVRNQAVYADSYQPIALAEIRKKEEREGVVLLDSTSITDRVIKPGETVWGVATWVDVDPKIDRFSIYINGLTNALRWEVEEDEAVDGEIFGAGRKIERKTLKLNFINPGDEAHSGGKEIYNNLPGELDYEWVFM